MQKKEVKKWQDGEALKRYRMIAPLLDEDLDEGKRRRPREEAAEKNGISKRSLYRHEEGCRSGGFEGLRPKGRTKKRAQRLPGNFDEIMEQAVQLKREVPKRSVRQIIKILELEGWAAPGVLKQSAKRSSIARIASLESCSTLPRAASQVSSSVPVTENGMVFSFLLSFIGVVKAVFNSTGEIIRIGRAIAKSPLRKYCMERPVLFVGVESTYDDVFADVEIDEDER